MEYQTGVKKKDTLEITELLNAKTGEAVKVNGAVHTIRDMGTVAFVILRKTFIIFKIKMWICLI